MPILVVRHPDGTEQESELVDQLTLGRSDENDWVLPEGGVSRRHARFFIRAKVVWVEDIGSANGTWVNGSRVEKAVGLKAGSKVRIGEYEISVKSVEPKESPPSAMVRSGRGAAASDPPAPRRSTKMVQVVRGTATAQRDPKSAALTARAQTPSLRGLSGPWLNQVFPLKGTQVLGRDPGVDIHIDDDSVSRKHAELTLSGSKLLVCDLGSSNGTMLNGVPITDEVVVAPGDLLQFGVIEMVFEAPAATRAGRGGRRSSETSAGESSRTRYLLLGVAGVVFTVLAIAVGYKLMQPSSGPTQVAAQNPTETFEQSLGVARGCTDLLDPDWDKCYEAVEKALALEPIHPEANELKRRIVKERGCKELYDKGIKLMRLREDEALDVFSKIPEDCSYFLKVKPRVKEAVEQVMKKTQRDCETYSNSRAWSEALISCQKYMEFACQDMPREQLYPPTTQVMCIGAPRKKAKKCFMPKDRMYVKFLQVRLKVDPQAPMWMCPDLALFRKPNAAPDPRAQVKAEIRKRIDDRELSDSVSLYMEGKFAEATNILQRILERNDKAKLHAFARQIQRDIAEVEGLYKAGTTDISNDDPERAEEPLKEALAIDERLVLGAEKAALPEADKKADLERMKSYVRDHVQRDMAAACYRKGSIYLQRSKDVDKPQACKVWRLGFWFYKGNSDLNKAVTNVCTREAKIALENATDCTSLASVLDFEVPGDSTREAYEAKKAQMKCH